MLDPDDLPSTEGEGSVVRQPINYPPQAFVAVISSHGSENRICGVNDGRRKPSTAKPETDFTTIEAVKNILNNENCPHLKDKPKLLFVQACRGNKEDKGVPNHVQVGGLQNVRTGHDGEIMDSETSVEKVLDLIVHPSNAPEPARSGAGQKETDTERYRATNKETNASVILYNTHSPIMSDIMICYSTLSGYRSYVRSGGSIFGVALAETFIEYAHQMDISRILQKLTKKVADEEIPEYSSTRSLTSYRKQAVHLHYISWYNQLYFNPGYTKEKISLVEVDPQSSNHVPKTRIHSTRQPSSRKVGTKTPNDAVVVSTRKKSKSGTGRLPGITVAEPKQRWKQESIKKFLRSSSIPDTKANPEVLHTNAGNGEDKILLKKPTSTEYKAGDITSRFTRKQVQKVQGLSSNPGSGTSLPQPYKAVSFHLIKKPTNTPIKKKRTQRQHPSKRKCDFSCIADVVAQFPIN